MYKCIELFNMHTAYNQRLLAGNSLSLCAKGEADVDWSVEETRVLIGLEGKANVIQTSTCYRT